MQNNVKHHPQEVGPTDILVGIPSFNNQTTIGHVVSAVRAGLAKYFPDRKALIVNSDGGSTDGTADAVSKALDVGLDALLIEHPLHPINKIITPYHGIPGKGSALRMIFELAEKTGARACAVVDSDLRSITPEWVQLLIGPVIRENFDFVAPLYHRHKYDGTITNSIVYPLTRALYGKRVRQPIGGDFGFSGRLASHYLSQDVWHTDVARFGIDIWMTTTAVTDGFSVCQSFLGAKIHDPKDPGVDLSSMLTQVVSSVFDLMEKNHSLWEKVAGSEPVPLFGFQYAVGLEPVAVNTGRMIRQFNLGMSELGEVWEKFLSPEVIRELLKLTAADEERFIFPPELWVKTIYEFGAAYHKRLMGRDHLLRALTPLYLGRTAAFVLETRDADANTVDGIIEDLCLGFERQKKKLAEDW